MAGHTPRSRGHPTAAPSCSSAATGASNGSYPARPPPLGGTFPHGHAGCPSAVSPDGQTVVFWAKGAIIRAPLDGGPAETLAPAIPEPPHGVAQGVSGRVVFAADDGEIWQVSSGSAPTAVTSLAQKGSTPCRNCWRTTPSFCSRSERRGGRGAPAGGRAGPGHGQAESPLAGRGRCALRAKWALGISPARAADGGAVESHPAGSGRPPGRRA